MKGLRFLLILASLYGAGYGYWGAFTEDGNRQYEGMAALLPFYIMLGSLGMLAIIGLYHAVRYLILKKR